MKTILFVFALLLSGLAYSHGDDHSDHAHAAPSAVLETNAAVPTLSTQSELFEIVARLYDDELGLYIDDWRSNAPVLNAEVEVEFNGRKAIAKFHADHGDYAVADPEMLKALHAEGTHALMFTVSAGKDADLLTGDLKVHAETALTGPGAGKRWLFIGGVGVVILVGCGLAIQHLLRSRKGERA